MVDIEVENLTKRFGDFCAVDRISFSVGHGEIFGLLGPNGAGKSTLIRMMTTLITPTDGTVRIDGCDVIRDSDGVRRAIGVIPQAMTSDLDLTAFENMQIFAKLYGLTGREARPVIEGLLEAVDLVPWRDKPLKMFSGGMRRRLEIARGLVHAPKIFFLDEPTTGLDPVSRPAVWEMLAKLRKERDLPILMTLCDRIAIVDHGKLVALDSPLKLKASVPGRNVIEVSFAAPPPDWTTVLQKLPDVAKLESVDNVYRIGSHNGPATTLALMEAARAANLAILSLSVQSTTLDDVFVHFTGHQLRDALQTPTFQPMVRPGR